MSMLRLVVIGWVALSGCIAGYGGTFGSGKTAKQSQSDVVRDHVQPGVLDTEPTFSGTPRTVKIRVWADAAYRAQHLKWHDTFAESLGYANAVLGAKLGIQLHPEYLAWEFHAPSARLVDIATALTEHDPGNDAFAVVALTSSLPLVSATFEELGIAMVGGKHMVIRGYSDLEERQAFERAFPDLEATERQATLEAMRRHKTAAVLLHELGHSLGVGHDAETETLMHGGYSRLATSYSASALATMTEGIEERASTGAPKKPKKPTVTLLVFVSEDGDVIYNGNLLAGAALSELLRENRDADIQVRHAKGAPAAALTKLVERAKQACVTHISVGAVELSTSYRLVITPRSTTSEKTH